MQTEHCFVRNGRTASIEVKLFARFLRQPRVPLTLMAIAQKLLGIYASWRH